MKSALSNRPSALELEVFVGGTEVAMPASWHARISLPLK